MTRNSESHFGNIPTIDIKRSKFWEPEDHKTTINTGDIVPIYNRDMIPGDTVNISVSSLIRMATPIAPVMDNAWLDIQFYFVPNRLVWDHWKEFMGENNTDAWTQEVEYQEPITEAPETGWAKGTIASYLGARINTPGIWIDSKWLRGYATIYNEWFRSENVSEPAQVTKGDSDSVGSNGTDYVNDLELGGMPAKAVKYADAYTRGLPSPQKGPDVLLPLAGSAPIITGDEILRENAVGMKVHTTTAEMPVADSNLYMSGTQSGGPGSVSITSSPVPSGYIGEVYPTNLYANLSETGAATINQLRQAFAIQRMAETDARGGTRYIELIAAHFGIHSPDQRLQRPEYIGGKRIPINMADVVQNSATDAVTPQGNVAGVSKTLDTHDMVTYSATEHGMIFGLAIIRTEHTYQQGMSRELTRRKKLDYYWPALANIGEVYIKNKELYAQGTDADEEAFAYQEAWYEYRYGRNKVTGELNSDYATPLDIWHYGDDYSQLPTLSHEWLSETDLNVARTLAIQNQDQFICDFYFNATWVRPMPAYSIPSLGSWM